VNPKSDQTASPRVTVVMPVYNGERHLAEAMDSILAQSYRDFELVVVNDGSTDATAEIIASRDDGRIVVIDNRENLGLSKSLNIAFRRARSSLLARLDADDIAEPQRLARQVAEMERQPGLGMVASWFDEIDDEGRRLAAGRPPSDAIGIRWRLLFGNPIPPSTVMLRRDALADSAPHDESLSYAMDYELWCRLARANPVAVVEEVLVRYRKGSGSMTGADTHGDAVVEEPRRIAVEQMRQVAFDAGIDPDGFDACFCADAQALLWRSSLVRDGAAAFVTVRKLSCLHDAFCHANGFPTSEAAEHRRAVLTGLGRNLVRLCRESARTGDVARSAAFLTAAALARGELLLRRGRPVRAG
jgi:Glycosyl transferase family 2